MLHTCYRLALRANVQSIERTDAREGLEVGEGDWIMIRRGREADY